MNPLPRLLLSLLTTVIVIGCHPGNPQTGVYLQKLTKQSGSCPPFELEKIPRVHVVASSKPNTLTLIAPAPNGKGAFITIPQSGGNASGCDGIYGFAVQVADLGDSHFRLSYELTYQPRESSVCPWLAGDPTPACKQLVDVNYALEQACRSPCTPDVRETFSADGTQQSLSCGCI
jgi:hypothetical protein